jgi:nitronate monooxygenase
VAALAQGRTDMISFWSGQNTSNLKHHKASELMQYLIAEMSV